MRLAVIFIINCLVQLSFYLCTLPVDHFILIFPNHAPFAHIYKARVMRLSIFLKLLIQLPSILDHSI